MYSVSSAFCFIPGCEEPAETLGVSDYWAAPQVFAKAAYCAVHRTGGGMGVGTPVRRRPTEFRQLTKRSENSV